MPPSTAAELLTALNPSQRAAAEAVQGPVCILAGAGSGKTRTITHRIAHQVHSGVAQPEQILAVTFTERAAAEMRQRLRSLGLARPVRAATFHAAAWAQLRYFWGQVRPGAPLPDVLDSKLRLLGPVGRRLRVDGRDLAAEVEWAKARGLDASTYTSGIGQRTPPLPLGQMAQVFEEYEDDKRRRGLIDYDDMLGLTTRMLSEHPDVAAAVRDRYRFFTVDEFQDVSPAQWALLQAWLGDREELCVVGDDDQAIYSFTGATPSYLTDFTAHYPRGQWVALVDNYRSTPEVLALANRVLAGKRLRARLPSGPAPQQVTAVDEAAEVELVVDRIQSLITEGVEPAQIAVCYRINSQSEPFEAALAGREIAFTVRGDDSFYHRAEIRQALGLLRAAVGRPVERSPVPPVADAQPARPEAADRAVERVLREQLAWHPRRAPDGARARDRWRNLGALLEVAQREAHAQPELTLDALVTELERRAREGEPADEQAVSLLTMHKAKGLEFDAVFLVALEEGLLPISHARTSEEVAEERRLLYVGVTRARRHLHLSWAGTRTGPSGRVSRRRPSRFLEEVAPPGQRRSADPATAQRLRAWRRERARSDGVPAYVVFPDTTLAELAARRPGSLAELGAVPGLGPARVSRYGSDLLEMLAEG